MYSEERRAMRCISLKFYFDKLQGNILKICLFENHLPDSCDLLVQ